MTQPDDQPRRPVSPRNGLFILLGGFGVAAGAAWMLAKLFPLPGAAAALGLASGSDALWTLIGAGLLFPVCFGFFLLRLGGHVERKPILLAYGAGVYIAGCSAEMYVRDQLTLWPQLLVAVLACAVLSALFPAPPAEVEDDGPDDAE